MIIAAIHPPATTRAILECASLAGRRRELAVRADGRRSWNDRGHGVAASVDCNNSDPTIGAAPEEVAGVRVERVTGAARVSWISQDPTAGSATSYDLVTGDLRALRTNGGFAGAACLVNDVPDTPYDDARAGPATGAGWYDLVRAQHACTGTYGDSRGSLAGTCP